VLLAAGIVTCYLASSLPALVAGRILLACGSGAGIATALALAACVPARHRPRVLAGFGGVIAVFAAASPLAAGAVTAAASWRVALVLPALSLLAIPACMPLARLRGGTGRAVDIAGAALLTIAASALLMLIQAPLLHLPSQATVAIALVGVLAIVRLVIRVRRRPDGFVPRLVAGSGFIRPAAIGAGVYAASFASMYAVPQILHQEHGWSVLTVGFALLPGAVAGALLSRLAGRLTGRAGSLVLAAAAAVFAVLLAGAALTGPALALAAGASAGFAAYAAVQVILTAQVAAAVPDTQRGAALGLLALSYFVGGAAGSATAAALSRPLGLGGAVAVVAGAALVAGVLALTLHPAPTADSRQPAARRRARHRRSRRYRLATCPPPTSRISPRDRWVTDRPTPDRRYASTAGRLHTT